MNIQDYIRTIPDFPKPGINFYDIGTLLAEPKAWKYAIARLKEKVEAHTPDMLMGIESRGFLVSAALAHEMDIGFGMIRKKGKLPGETLSLEYDLEYGSDVIELQPDLIKENSKIALIDDLLATGGTITAAETLINQSGANVIASFCIIELEGLNGKEKLTAPFEALLTLPA